MIKNTIITLILLIGLVGCHSNQSREYIATENKYLKVDTMEFIYKNDPIKPVDSNYLKKAPSLKDNLSGTVFHRNYLEYLSLCYATHNGIVVKPDYIWYTILCEMSTIIKSDPEKYRPIFTDSDGKKDIQVMTGDPVLMPIDDLIKELFKQIPSELKQDDILLNFSTTDKSSTFGFSTSFLDAASPYYNYMMYMCGYNKIKVLGSVDDYKMMLSSLDRLKVIFDQVGTSKMEVYFIKTRIWVEAITAHFDDKNWWNQIFYVELCGSGHQEEVKGWFSELFAKYPSVGYVGNFSTHISVVEYKNLSTDMKYVMNSGIFSSEVDGDYLVPNFGFYIEKTE